MQKLKSELGLAALFLFVGLPCSTILIIGFNDPRVAETAKWALRMASFLWLARVSFVLAFRRPTVISKKDILKAKILSCTSLALALVVTFLMPAVWAPWVLGGIGLAVMSYVYFAEKNRK